jgi:hypothetical protein
MLIFQKQYCHFVLFIIIGFFQDFSLLAQNDIPVSPSNEIHSTLAIPTNIIEILKKNASDIDPISLVWRRTRTTTMDFESLIKKTNCLYDCGFLESINSVFMWQNGHSYLYFTDKNAVREKNLLTAYEVKKLGLTLIETIKERSFDGHVCCIGSGHEQTTSNTPTLLVYNLDQAKEKLLYFTICYPEYLTCAGYKFPLDASELEEPQTSYLLYLAEHGKLIDVREESDKENKMSLVIEIVAKEMWTKKDHHFTFWLSPKLNYAVERYDIKTIKGNLAYQILNSNFFQLSGKEVFLPQKCTQRCFTFMTIPDNISDNPLFEDEFLLADVSTKKINEKQFNIQKKYSTPGTLVGDHSIFNDLPNGVQYVVPANPADLDRVIEAALTGGDFVPTPLPSTTAIVIKWLLCIAGIAMIFYAGYEKFIKKKKKQ